MQDDVIERVLAGDREAFAAIVREHQRMLSDFAAFRIPDRDLVDEVVQQTFIRAYERLHEFEPGGDLGVWLRAICKFLMMAEIKRALAGRRRTGDYREHIRMRLLAGAMAACDGGAPDASIDLKFCLDQLQPRARQLIESRYLKEMSIERVASAFDQSTEWAATTLFRIRATLRKCLENQAQGEPLL